MSRQQMGKAVIATCILCFHGAAAWAQDGAGEITVDTNTLIALAIVFGLVVVILCFLLASIVMRLLKMSDQANYWWPLLYQKFGDGKEPGEIEKSFVGLHNRIVALENSPSGAADYLISTRVGTLEQDVQQLKRNRPPISDPQPYGQSSGFLKFGASPPPPPPPQAYRTAGAAAPRTSKPVSQPSVLIDEHAVMARHRRVIIGREDRELVFKDYDITGLNLIGDGMDIRDARLWQIVSASDPVYACVVPSLSLAYDKAWFGFDGGSKAIDGLSGWFDIQGTSQPSAFIETVTPAIVDYRGSALALIRRGRLLLPNG